MKKLAKIIAFLGIAAAIAFVAKTKLSESNAVEGSRLGKELYFGA